MKPISGRARYVRETEQQFLDSLVALESREELSDIAHNLSEQMACEFERRYPKILKDAAWTGAPVEAKAPLIWLDLWARCRSAYQRFHPTKPLAGTD